LILKASHAAAGSSDTVSRACSQRPFCPALVPFELIFKKLRVLRTVKLLRINNMLMGIKVGRCRLTL
jgi:hypothetical protein